MKLDFNVFAGNGEDFMRKVLYITNVEVPYRVKFFNQLSNYCNLTVLFESNKSDRRDPSWSKSVNGIYVSKFLSVGKPKSNCFSLKILKYIFGKYDSIIIGCYNSPVQMFATTLMKILRMKYVLNLDGEIFITEQKNIKNLIKKYFIKGAEKYIVAGESASRSLAKIIRNKPIISYPFSSLTQDEVVRNCKLLNTGIKREKNTVLVVGQFQDYKGLEVAVEAAKKCPEVYWRFVGTGKKHQEFISKCGIENICNIEVIPFLQKNELNREYMHCSALVLPSLQECWGLVINEAASFGLPIVSTWGSGAAVEYLTGSKYECYLSIPGDAQDLVDKVKNCLYADNAEYSEFLLEKNQHYSIEECVNAHLRIINKELDS